VLNGPQLGRGLQFADHWRTVLLVKKLDPHWCKAFSFHWTTVIHDTPDNTGSGYEYNFALLHNLETGFSILVEREDATQ